MSKNVTNLFKKGRNNSIHLPDRGNFSFRGNWIGVHNNTIMDQWHVGEVSSANYMITVEYDSNQKETIQMNVIARPDRATYNVYGRASLHDDLISLSVTVDKSICKVIVDPADTSYSGAKLIFHATYAETIHPLTPPSLIIDVSTDDSGINTYDTINGTFDNSTVTFDRV